MKKIGLITFLIPFLCALTSCHVPSRTSMYGRGGRAAYNRAIQNTTNQELLLNLVRLRYSDTPYFLDVNSVTTQFTSTSKFSPSIKLSDWKKGPLPFNLGTDITWQNQPTIQYAPLKGKDFAIQLMHPLSLSIIQGLIYTGWDVDRIFRLLIQSMSEVPNASGASGPIPQDQPEYQRFLEIVTLLRHFQLAGKLQVGVHHIAKKEGEEDLGAVKTKPNTIQLLFPAEGPKAKRLAEILKGVKTSKDKYILNMKQNFNQNAELGIMTRSLLSCMYYLSLGVQVPERDRLSGVVGNTRCKDGGDFDWNQVVGDLIKVYSSSQYPDNAYLAVSYRGHWFYVDDLDISSKRTFVLLQQIYNLQAKQSDQNPPLLSLPLS